jgi:hypothetical protein
VVYRDGTAKDWPKACRPKALWATVAPAAQTQGVVVAKGVAVANAPGRLTVTWRTRRSTVWRKTTHNCSTGAVVNPSTAV